MVDVRNYSLAEPNAAHWNEGGWGSNVYESHQAQNMEIDSTEDVAGADNTARLGYAGMVGLEEAHDVGHGWGLNREEHDFGGTEDSAMHYESGRVG